MDYDEMSVSLTMNNYGQTVSITERGDVITWMDLTDTFLQFLKGCGYHQVDAADIVEYLNGAYGPFNQPDPKDNTVTVNVSGTDTF